MENYDNDSEELFSLEEFESLNDEEIEDLLNAIEEGEDNE